MTFYLYDFLRMFDAVLPTAVYINDEEVPVWEGSLFNMPWWLTDIALNYEVDDRYPISYREDFGEEYNHSPGLVIFLKE